MEHDEQHAAGELFAMADWIAPGYYRLTESTCLIGRLASCHIVARHALVSRQHARIERQGTRYLLTDVGSANGTYVNGQPLVAPHLLISDDVIGLGEGAGALRFADPDETRRVRKALVYDERSLQFTLNRAPVTLTPLQLRFLLHLYRNQGRVCSREECARAVWGEGFDPGADAGRLDQLVSSVRQALRRADQQEQGAADGAADMIQARRGLGYTLQA